MHSICLLGYRNVCVFLNVENGIFVCHTKFSPHLFSENLYRYQIWATEKSSRISAVNGFYVVLCPREIAPLFKRKTWIKIVFVLLSFTTKNLNIFLYLCHLRCSGSTTEETTCNRTYKAACVPIIREYFWDVVQNVG